MKVKSHKIPLILAMVFLFVGGISLLAAYGEEPNPYGAGTNPPAPIWEDSTLGDRMRQMGTQTVGDLNLDNIELQRISQYFNNGHLNELPDVVRPDSALMWCWGVDPNDTKAVAARDARFAELGYARMADGSLVRPQAIIDTGSRTTDVWAVPNGGRMAYVDGLGNVRLGADGKAMSQTGRGVSQDIINYMKAVPLTTTADNNFNVEAWLQQNGIEALGRENSVTQFSATQLRALGRYFQQHGHQSDLVGVNFRPGSVAAYMYGTGTDTKLSPDARNAGYTVANGQFVGTEYMPNIDTVDVYLLQNGDKFCFVDGYGNVTLHRDATGQITARSSIGKEVPIALAVGLYTQRPIKR